MTEWIEEVARRLVVGHKRDGRSVYDEVAKRELVEFCLGGSMSVARVARTCGLNANLLTSWIRGRGRKTATPMTGCEIAEFSAVTKAFIPVAIEQPAIPPAPLQVTMQARLPNGVALDLRDVDLRHIGEVLDALGRLRCSASTRG